MIFGAYDRKLHFVDAETGRPTRSPILTGDIIKGTPTIDPDGYPIVYFGSRDNKVRAIALDRSDPIGSGHSTPPAPVDGMTTGTPARSS